MPADAVPAANRHGAQVDLGRLLGIEQAAAAAPATSRYQLLGTVAPKSAAAREAGEGVALIAVDGVPRTVRVGALLDTGLRLLAVDARSASLGEGGAVSQKLQLAVPTPASTGALAPAAPSTTVLGGSPQQIPAGLPPVAPLVSDQLPQQPPGNRPEDAPLR